MYTILDASENIDAQNLPRNQCTLSSPADWTIVTHFYTDYPTAPSLSCSVFKTQLQEVLYLAPWFCHIAPILYELHWLPVTFRKEFKVIVITHKAIYGTAPNYLSSLVNFKPNSSYSLRSNNKYLLSNPNFRTLHTLGDRAFVAAAPKLWNNLPLDLRCTSDFQVFKRNLKTHLFKKAFSDIML